MNTNYKLVRHITVIGSGVMGRGIAYVSAAAGFSTILVDINEQALEAAAGEIRKTFQKGVERAKITAEEAEYAQERLRYTNSINEGAAEADLIIEAVPENLDIKKAVFQQLEEDAQDSCLFATNTSTMSPTEIGSFTSRPERTIAMHFFNPVHKMPLVEIVRGLETSDQTAKIAEQTARQMGKETVVVNEFPGFVTSRISALVGNEAFYMLQEGVGTPEEIDRAIKLGLNYPMGPFELGDLVGLDTRLNNLNYLHKTLGEKYRPSPLLVKYVKAGRLGRKTGKGVYEYTSRKEEVR
ncbi:3-hydroxybutyryl-CoA dehydrogenase [Alteribacter lacisalsi]|uniref:3-hydroxybutyryl-CoA dehydrogenase n=1 Tax=Alteribacter lacisalsi TaxID=2045244 RepID=A0A2W0HLW3_9BACI|nr:3-hydroxyacyl-CoA dehydrogenase [Alteribacter lacisalsi]PYZ97859.1 3-hydroxybutyryl-CoA dehydrogenase [Alteribacter lacisalsi]